MTVDDPFSQIPSPEKGAQHFKKATDLERKGQFEVALTEYRRAVLADPNNAGAHVAIGRMCRQKSEQDPIFLRYSYEAFQKAARISRSDDNIQDQYILAAQKQGRLDDLLTEYDGLLKADPENELFKRCRKNILSISMAMMPDKVNIATAGTGQKLRKLVLIVSIGGLFLGAILLASPVLFRNSKVVKKEHLKNFVKIGIFLSTIGVGGLIGRSFIK